MAVSIETIAGAVFKEADRLLFWEDLVSIDTWHILVLLSTKPQRLMVTPNIY